MTYFLFSELTQVNCSHFDKVLIVQKILSIISSVKPFLSNAKFINTLFDLINLQLIDPEVWENSLSWYDADLTFLWIFQLLGGICFQGFAHQILRIWNFVLPLIEFEFSNESLFILVNDICRGGNPQNSECGLYSLVLRLLDISCFSCDFCAQCGLSNPSNDVFISDNQSDILSHFSKLNRGKIFMLDYFPNKILQLIPLQEQEIFSLNRSVPSILDIFSLIPSKFNPFEKIGIRALISEEISPYKIVCCDCHRYMNSETLLIFNFYSSKLLNLISESAFVINLEFETDIIQNITQIEYSNYFFIAACLMLAKFYDFDSKALLSYVERSSSSKSFISSSAKFLSELSSHVSALIHCSNLVFVENHFTSLGLPLEMFTICILNSWFLNILNYSDVQIITAITIVQGFSFPLIVIASWLVRISETVLGDRMQTTLNGGIEVVIRAIRSTEIQLIDLIEIINVMLQDDEINRLLNSISFS
jgi:hypothetical protein